VTNQLVTVVGPNNNWVVVKVTPEHIALIKVNEKIPSAIPTSSLRSGRDCRQGHESADGGRAGLGRGDADRRHRPLHVEVTDTVAAIDRTKRIIAFAGTGGKTHTIAIAPTVAGFNQVKIGDMVVLEVTRAVAISVKPA